MRKKLVTFIIVMMFIINLIVGALLLIDIQLMEAPEATISIDITELNAEEVILQTSIDISNPNIFELVTKDFEIVSTTPDGDEVARLLLEGGSIPPGDNRTFTSVDVIAFDGARPDILTTKMTGKVGLNIGFIQKTIPLAINIITSLEDVMKELMSPSLNIQVEFGELTQEGINLTGIIEVYNPNTIDIIIDDVSVTIETETGKNVGNLDIVGGVIESESSFQLKSSGMILLEVLNAKTLYVKMSGKAGARIAGINESISFSSEVQIKVPDISTLFSPNKPTNLIIKGDFKFTPRGLEDNLVLEVHNPNKIAIEFKDVTVTMYSINKEEKKLLCEVELEEGIVEAESVKQLKGSTIIPFSDLLPPKGERLLPDAIEITVRANVTIPGIDYTMWVGVTGGQDFRIFQ